MKEIKINWDYMGAKLANLDDEEQAKFFIGFAKELDSWDTHYRKEMQMVHISLKLDKKIKEILNTYLTTIFTD